MSAEVLRRAAALMRELAEAATTHTPWQLLEGDDYAPPWTVASTHVEGERTWVCKDARDAGEHIASWHPAVALAVADWLDEAAVGWLKEQDRQWGLTLIRHDWQIPEGVSVRNALQAKCDLAADERFASPLTVARAYLGEDA